MPHDPLGRGAAPARRRAEAEKKTQEAMPRGSAYREFPTAQPMPADAAWRRDLYLTVDLGEEANAVLYYPTVPTDGRVNLFTYLFKLMLRGQLQAYDYKLDGNEDFSEKNKVKARTLLDRYKIRYETNGEKIRVSDADLPSDEVKAYFLKVSRYYDQHTASFRQRVDALCPVLRRGDEFGVGDTQYPMFWVRYADVAPQLGKLILMGSNLNNAATLSADDFFTTAAYKGTIYKTVNLQDRLLGVLPHRLGHEPGAAPHREGDGRLSGPHVGPRLRGHGTRRRREGCGRQHSGGRKTGRAHAPHRHAPPHHRQRDQEQRRRLQEQQAQDVSRGQQAPASRLVEVGRQPQHGPQRAPPAPLSLSVPALKGAARTDGTHRAAAHHTLNKSVPAPSIQAPERI